MQAEEIANKTVIVGVFNTVPKADRAVRELREADFEDEQIGIVCSKACHQEFFPDIADAELEKEASPKSAIATGGVVGGAIGGLALAATAVMTAGIPLLAAGTILVAGGAIAGSFAGAMATLGYDKSTVDRCERLVAEGKILVAVHDFPPSSTERLAEAQRIMAEAGVNEVIWVAEKV